MGSIIADVRYLSIFTGSKGPKGAFWAKMGPFRTPRGPEGARYQVKVCGDLTSIDLRGPQKGHFKGKTCPMVIDLDRALPMAI